MNAIPSSQFNEILARIDAADDGQQEESGSFELLRYAQAAWRSIPNCVGREEGETRPFESLLRRNIRFLKCVRLLRSEQWKWPKRLTGSSGLAASPGINFPMRIARRLAAAITVRTLRTTERLVLVRDLGLEPDACPRSPFRALHATLPRILDLLARHQDTGSGGIVKALEVLRNEVPEAATEIQRFLSTSSLQWLDSQLAIHVSRLPKDFLSNGSIGKLARAIVGVMGFAILLKHNRHHCANPPASLDRIIEAGFHFGRTYCFDEILDSPGLLSAADKSRYCNSVISYLRHRGARPIDKHLMGHPVLGEVFESLDALRHCYPADQYERILDAYLCLANAQAQEHSRSLDGNYSEQEIYTTLIVKSASTRLLPALLAEVSLTPRFIQHSCMVGLVNQLLDDFRDFNEDLENGTFTPYTFCASKGRALEQMAHPLLVYLNAIEAVSKGFRKAREVRALLFSRFVHGVRTFTSKGGPRSLERFFELMPTKRDRLEKTLLDISHYCDAIFDPEAIFQEYVSLHVRKRYRHQTLLNAMDGK